MDFWLIKGDLDKRSIELAKDCTVTDSGNKYTHIVKVSFISKLKPYVLLNMGQLVTVTFEPRTQMIESIRPKS